VTRRLTPLAVLPMFWLAMSVAPSPAAQSPAAESRPSAITQVVLLGTGVPGWNPDSSGPATAIVVRDTPYLVDFGPGVVRRAGAAYKASRPCTRRTLKWLS
jgi:hypothetical protein